MFDHLPAPCAESGCPSDPAARALLGCDAPADRGYTVWCPACRGRREGCSQCEGGQIEVNRCPVALATPEVIDMLRAYGHYKSGFLPVSGGWLDQSVTFCSAVSMIGSIVSHHEEIDMERSRGR